MAKFDKVQVILTVSTNQYSGIVDKPFVEDAATLFEYNVGDDFAGKKVYARAIFKDTLNGENSEWSEIRNFKISPIPHPGVNGPDEAISGWTCISDPNKDVPGHPDKPWLPNFHFYNTDVPYDTYLNPVLEYNRLKFDPNTNDITNVLPYKTGTNTPYTSFRSNRVLKNVSPDENKYTNLITPTVIVTGSDVTNYTFDFPYRPFSTFGKRIGYGAAYFNPADTDINKRNGILNRYAFSELDSGVTLADDSARLSPDQEAIAGYPATIPVPYTTATGGMAISGSNLQLKDVGLTGALYFAVRYSDTRSKEYKYRTPTFPGKQLTNDNSYTTSDYNNAKISYFIRDAIQYPRLPSETDLKQIFPSTQFNNISGAFAPTKLETNIRLTPFPDLILKGVENKFVVDGELSSDPANPFVAVTVASSDPLVKLYLSSQGISTAGESVTFNFNDRPEITLITEDNPNFINAVYLRVSFHRYPTAVASGNPAASSIKIYKLRPVINQLGYSSHYQNEIDYLPCVYLTSSMTHREPYFRTGNTNNVKYRSTVFTYDYSNVSKVSNKKLRLTSASTVTDDDGINDTGTVTSTSYFSTFNITSGFDNLGTLKSNTSQPIPQIGFTKDVRLSSDYSIPVLALGNFTQYESTFVGITTTKALGNSTLFRKFTINNKDMGSVENVDRIGGINTTGWGSYRLAPLPSLDPQFKKMLISLPLDCQVIPLILENKEKESDTNKKYTYLATIDGQAMHIITDTTFVKS